MSARPVETEKEVHDFLVRAEKGDPRTLPGETAEVRWSRPADLGALPQDPDSARILRAALAAL